MTTKKGETLVGVIAAENATGITLRSPSGDVEIKEDDIALRENTRRSLMPEGFDAMGAEALRDIVSFIAAGDQRVRIVDIRKAYTASSRRGFRREDDTTETVPLHSFGDVTVNGVVHLARGTLVRSLETLTGAARNVTQQWPHQSPG